MAKDEPCRSPFSSDLSFPLCGQKQTVASLGMGYGAGGGGNKGHLTYIDRRECIFLLNNPHSAHKLRKEDIVFFPLIRLAIRDAFCTTLHQMTTGRPSSFSLCFSETLRKDPNGGGTIPTRRAAPPLTASEFCVLQELVSSAETQLTTVTGPRRASGFCPVRSECSVIRQLVTTSLELSMKSDFFASKPRLPNNIFIKAVL